MDFTREPIIETIVTPKEGCKLVVRSSKGAGQEEYFVESLEIVSFGHALFFRSLERPKAFIVPVSDYEVLEVREARMVLKNAGLDRSIKIGGGRDGGNKPVHREQEKPDFSANEDKEQSHENDEEKSNLEISTETRSEPRLDKKRDRRRNYRKRRGRDDKEEFKEEQSSTEPVIPSLEDDKIMIPAPLEGEELLAGATGANVFSSLLQPPPTLISETINRYRENALFKNAFFLSDEEQYKPHDKVQDLLNEDDESENAPLLQTPAYANDLVNEELITHTQEIETEKNHVEEICEDDLIQEDVKEDLAAHENLNVPFEQQNAGSSELTDFIEEETLMQEEPLYSFLDVDDNQVEDANNEQLNLNESNQEMQETESSNVSFDDGQAILPLYAEEEAYNKGHEEELPVSLLNDESDDVKLDSQPKDEK